MDLPLKEIGDVVLLSMDGRITLGKIKDIVNEQVAQGKRKIVVDLREVSYIDSTGIGDLVAAYTLAKHHGGVIKLVSDTKKIDDLLDITRISSVIDKYTTSEEAIRSF
jgi:anti-sigma B factor antagonist